MVMYLLLFSLLPSLLAAQDCGLTELKVKDVQFNFNHLKNHLPPSQTYQKQKNLYAKDPKDKNKFVFFNILDVVHSDKIDSKTIVENCSPKSLEPERTTNRPAACRLEEDKSKCPAKKQPCWIALGDCKNVTVSEINEKKLEEGVKILYKGGDKLDEKTEAYSFLVKIKCCKSGDCLKSLPSPITLASKDCEGATSCVEFSSPYGCSCDDRTTLDKQLGVKEFDCALTPKGLKDGLSVGSWLLIFLFLVVGGYLGFGMAYNYNEGRRGMEMIPHLDMWCDIGGLIVDGFNYVKSCGEYRSGVQYSEI